MTCSRASPNLPYSKEKKRLKNAEIVTNSFRKVRQKNFSPKEYLDWKNHAKHCYDHMAKVAKGAFCSVCDLEENSRISQKHDSENDDLADLDPKQYGTKHRRMKDEGKKNDTPKPKYYELYLSTGDAFAFSNKCYDYIATSRKLLNFLYDVRNVMQFKSRAHFKDILIPKKLNHTTHHKVLSSMRKCANDASQCSDNNIIKYFYDINMGTKIERKYYKFVTSMALQIDRSLNSQDFIREAYSIYRSLLYDDFSHVYDKTFRANNELHKPEIVKITNSPLGEVIEKDADGKKIKRNYFITPNGIFENFTRNVWQFHTESYRQFAPAQRMINFSFRINKKYKKMLTTMDTYIPMPALNDFKMFQKGLHCPYAPMVGGSIAITNNKREGRKICPNVKLSCCHEYSFMDFKIDWRKARLFLDSRFKADMQLLEFLTGELLDTVGFIKYAPFEKAPKDKKGSKDRVDTLQKVRNCRGQVNNARCKDLYYMIEKSTEHARMYQTQYKQDYHKCHRVIEAIRNELKCASCDENASKYFNAKNKQIIMDKKQINEVIVSCYDMDLFEVELEREVLLSYQNYAKQIYPALTIDHKILFNIFSDKYKPCSEWIDMSNSLKESDFTRGRECVKYAYEKLEIIKQDADDMRLNPSIVIFLQEIMQVLGSTHAKYRLDVIVPESIKPDYLRYHGHFNDRRLAAAVIYFI